MRFPPFGRGTLVALICTAAWIVAPPTARAELIALECSGGFSGTYLVDPAIGTVALYADRKATYFTEVVISGSIVSFTDDHPATISSYRTTANFRIDLKTGHAESQIYSYAENRINGSLSHAGQCKKVPNPK